MTPKTIKKIIFFLFLITSLQNTYAQKKKIGLLLHVYGPYFFTNTSIPINTTGAFNMYFSAKDSIDEGNKFNQAFTYFKSNTISPYDSILNIYSHLLDNLNHELVIVEDNINDKNAFPIFKKAKTNFNFFLQDLTSLKDKYGIDSLLTLTVYYGFLVEKYMAINLDKKTLYKGKVMLIDLTNNKITSNTHITDIQNIKNWNQPPNYPSIIQSYNKLLQEKLYPSIKEKLLKIMNGSKMP